MAAVERAKAAAVLLAMTSVLAVAPPAGGSVHDDALIPAVVSVVDPLVAYRGLGTWVDIYDSSPYNRPRVAVRKMAERGVKTLYLQTANYRSSTAIHRPAAVSRLVEAAHRRSIRVVAWYLPSFARLKRDYRRAMAAIRFRTENGEVFDSFALDIEATVVKDIETRNRRARTLARRLREAVGPSYPMGAIVPEANALYWPDFPYPDIASRFDVFLPMAYFTYRTSGFHRVYRFVSRNIHAIRNETGDPYIPIHAIGGVAEDATLRETSAYVKAIVDGKTMGGSLYAFTTTTPGQWAGLQKVPQ